MNAHLAHLREQVAKLQREVTACTGAINRLKRQRNKLKTALTQVEVILCEAPELNLVNYDESQVAELNAAVIEAYPIIAKALGNEKTDPCKQ